MITNYLVYKPKIMLKVIPAESMKVKIIANTSYNKRIPICGKPIDVALRKTTTTINTKPYKPI